MTKNEFVELCQKVKSLPYGRNSNRYDLSLVLSEGKGTCSSKHGYLKHEADEAGIPDVQLILGMYKMSNSNTPKIGDELIENDLASIPEAHCYLRIDGKRFDFTSPSADISKIENDILEEIEILPAQVAQFKIDFHKAFLKNWIQKNRIDLTFDQIWSVREKCIQNLSGNDK